MMSNIRKDNIPPATSKRVGEIGTTITGKTPSTKYEEYFDGEIMFITPADLKQNYYLEKSERYITKAGLDSIRKNSISGKSVLVGCIGSDLGNIAMVDKECATNQQINSITKIKDEYNPEYIYYWFNTKKAWLHLIAGNTTTPIINKTDFDNILIPFPDKAKQDKVVEVLSTIDKKIALNNRLIKASENLMHEIYDYWFVQFDFPDENGHPYKSSGGEMVYCQTLKKSIPKKWSTTKLSSIIDVSKQGDWGVDEKTSENDMRIACIRGTDLDLLSRGPIATYTERFISSKHKERALTYGDFVIEISGTPGRSAYINNNLLSQFDCPLIASNFCQVLSMKQCYSLYWFKNLWESLYYAGVADHYSGQTTMKNLQFELMANSISIALPNPELLQKYHEIASNAYERIQLLITENRYLASLRDWLLPMLMNGQIKVSG